MIIETVDRAPKRAHTAREAQLQARCFQRCWNEYPETRKLLFHVANENDRADSNAIQGAMRKSLGIIKGVADLILMIPRGPWHGLCIEMKDVDGWQRPEQKEWQMLVERQGYRYEIIRTEADFMALIKEYLGTKKNEIRHTPTAGGHHKPPQPR